MTKLKTVLASISILAGVVQFSPSARATEYLYSYSGSYGEFSIVADSLAGPYGENPLDVLLTYDFVPDLDIVSIVFSGAPDSYQEIEFLSTLCENSNCYNSTFPTNSFYTLGTHMGYDANDATSTLVVSAYGTPEASTWAMMLLGFGGLGFVGYVRSRRPAMLD